MSEFRRVCRLAVGSAHEGECVMIENLFRPTHLILVLGIALLVFGPKNLPSLGRGLGEAIRGFKEPVKKGEDDLSLKQ
jgi:sec-independent protein translocase protein TatA